MKKALIGAGCFWGVEEYYRILNGVTDTKVGFSGGNIANPSYEDVCNGTTKHAEVVKIEFDEKLISYKEIIAHFWLCHDPSQLNQQGLDIGSQYRSVIFYYSDDQKKIAQQSKVDNQIFFDKKIVTEIIKLSEFYLAEDYHQLYIKKRA